VTVGIFGENIVHCVLLKKLITKYAAFDRKIKHEHLSETAGFVTDLLCLFTDSMYSPGALLLQRKDGYKCIC
jgi:hypothetical protein